MTKKRKQVSKDQEGFERTMRVARINGLRAYGSSSLRRYDLDCEDNWVNEEREKEPTYRLLSKITGMAKKRKQVSKDREGFESTMRVARINGLRTYGYSSMRRCDSDCEDDWVNEEREKELTHRLLSQVTGSYSERDEGNELMGILEKSETPWTPEVSSEVVHDEVELGAEYCPEAITEYLNLKSQRGNKRGLLQEMMRKAKMHLLASGWKLEGRLATHRYFSSSGKVYYCLYRACIGYKREEEEQQGSTHRCIEQTGTTIDEPCPISLNTPHNFSFNSETIVRGTPKLPISISSSPNEELTSGCPTVDVVSDVEMEDFSLPEIPVEEEDWVTDEDIRPSISKKSGLIEKDKDLKPAYSPVALKDYLLLFKSDISESQKIKIGKWMAPKVMEHLLAIGWSLSYTWKKSRYDRRYNSPKGKRYASLHTACLALEREVMGLVQNTSGSKMRDSSITKKSMVIRDTRISKEKISRATRKSPINRKLNLANSAPPPSSWPPLGTSANREVDLQNSVPPQSSFPPLCSNTSREFDLANSVPPPPLCSNANKELDLSNSVTPLFSLPPLCTRAPTRKMQRQHHLARATDRQGDKTFKVSNVSRKNKNQSGICRELRNLLGTQKKPRDVSLRSGKPCIRTVFSWMIDHNVILPREKLSYYVDGEDSCVKGKARVSREGIKCNCCSEVYGIADFEAHVKTHSTQIFVEDGRSLYDCQRQMLDQSVLKDLRLKSCERKKTYYNQCESDEICSICLYGGDLVLCDRCPSAYHLTCLHLKVCLPFLFAISTLLNLPSTMAILFSFLEI
ncbi:hypothetical protein AMTR_s00007p00138750 [Amborella trichopoda]|uniref:Uncharacterized protein n=1 Tax=Amborella trichopoda TaxID=13333 RepID=W1PE00_AMBTC|nr:hypothetical protein AMTR_s00007p00138750 [Amborella trichopoda]